MSSPGYLRRRWNATVGVESSLIERRARSFVVSGMRRALVAVLWCLAGCEDIDRVQEPPRDAAKMEQPTAGNASGSGLASSLAIAPGRRPASELGEHNPTVLIMDVDARSITPMFEDHRLEVLAKARFDRPLEGRTELWLKSRCSRGYETHVDFAPANLVPVDRSPHRVQIWASLDNAHDEGPGTKCELVFVRGSALHQEVVKRACWDGKHTTQAACAPPIAVPEAAVSPSSAKVVSVENDYHRGLYLDLRYEVLAHRPIDEHVEFEIAAACLWEDAPVIEFSSSWGVRGPLRAEPGEVFDLHSEIFFLPEHDETPKHCDLSLVTPSEYGDIEVLDRRCLRKATIGAGTCDGIPRPATPPRKIVTSDTLAASLDDVHLYPASSPRRSLRLTLGLTVLHHLYAGETLELHAACDLASARVEDASRLALTAAAVPGDRLVRTLGLFEDSPLGATPDRCELSMVNDTRTHAVLHSFCWESGAVRTGPC